MTTPLHRPFIVRDTFDEAAFYRRLLERFERAELTRKMAAQDARERRARRRWFWTACLLVAALCAVEAAAIIWVLRRFS